MPGAFDHISMCCCAAVKRALRCLPRIALPVLVFVCSHIPGPHCKQSHEKVLRGFEPRSLDSESRVLAVTP